MGHFLWEPLLILLPLLVVLPFLLLVCMCFFFIGKWSQGRFSLRNVIGIKVNSRRKVTGVGAICCILLLFLHPFGLFHFHASYNFRPLQLLKYTIAQLQF